MRQAGRCQILLLSLLLTGCGIFTTQKLRDAQETRAPIFISSIILKPNLVNPVEIIWYNPGPQTIYRVHFFISVYNKDGRKLLEEQTTLSGNYLPMDKKEGAPFNRVWWLGDWYRSSMVCLMVDRIDITFTDDSKIVLDSKEALGPLLDVEVAQECEASETG